MRYVKFQNDKKHQNAKINVENITVTTSDKLHKKNDSSSQASKEYSVFNHSTPVMKRQSANKVEDSPDFDYFPSPILLSCTQESGNEVAWDWQSSQSKTPERKGKKQNVQCETPKGTKPFQRKRNSNSPLLYMPHKRKTLKMKNMENIGQFSAELQKLNERIGIIKQNENNQLSNHVEEVVNMNKEKKMSRIKESEQNCTEKANGHSNANKNGASESYDDLFDESIEESMIRCTQEIEEKFNLIGDIENVTHSQANIKKEESSCTSETPIKTSVQFSSNENSKEPSPKNIFSKNTKDNNILRTYSKLSMRRDSNTSVHATTQKSKNLHKSCINNNKMHSCIQKPCDNKKSSDNNVRDLFNFPDDSFDDCLATCIEDEELLSVSANSDDFLAHRNDSKKFETSCEHLTNAPLKSEIKSTSSIKSTMKVETFNSTLENRKFFKTKSLSDQYIQDTASASCYTTRPNSNSMISRTNVTRASVSTNPIVTNTHVQNTGEDCANSLMCSMGRTHGSDVNRCAVKEGGDRFVRYHSTGNMKNNTKEITKSGSQPTRCTAEEIEKKRLQAIMRLEAKKKLYAMKITNNINR